MYNQNKYEEAIECYDKAIQINPNYSEAFNNKGLALGDLNKYEEALKTANLALFIWPNNLECHQSKLRIL